MEYVEGYVTEIKSSIVTVDGQNFDLDKLPETLKFLRTGMRVKLGIRYGVVEKCEITKGL